MADHTELYDRIAADFAAAWGDDKDGELLERFCALLVERHDGRAPSVLDAGCGHGPHLGRFTEAGFTVIGVDASTEMCRLATEAGHTAIVDDLRTLARFDDALFDGIWSCASLVHLDDTEAAAAIVTLRRVAVDGAVAMFRVKAAGPGREDSGVEEGGQLSYDGGRWFRWWNADEFTAALSQGGWRTDSCDEVPDGRRPGLSWLEVFATATPRR